MSSEMILAILQLLIAATAQAPQITAAIQEILDHKQPWTADEAAAFRARMEARFASPDWQVTP